MRVFVLCLKKPKLCILADKDSKYYDMCCQILKVNSCNYQKLLIRAVIKKKTHCGLLQTCLTTVCVGFPSFTPLGHINITDMKALLLFNWPQPFTVKFNASHKYNSHGPPVSL